jgi:hypothetical protein
MRYLLRVSRRTVRVSSSERGESTGHVLYDQRRRLVGVVVTDAHDLERPEAF